PHPPTGREPPRHGKELDASGPGQPQAVPGLMNYQHPQLLDELAAQYVLGTLRGQARRRFERYCARNVSALHAVRRWEDRLVDMVAAVVPVAPSPLVWHRIKFRIRRGIGT